MAKDVKPSAPSVPPPETFIAGIRKLGPQRYAVVTGTIANPIVDTVAQPLEYAAEAMKLAVLKMLNVMP